MTEPVELIAGDIFFVSGSTSSVWIYYSGAAPHQFLA